MLTKKIRMPKLMHTFCMGVVFSAFFLRGTLCLAQFSWVSFVTLSNDLPNGQVGLTAFNNKLIMT